MKRTAYPSMYDVDNLPHVSEIYRLKPRLFLQSVQDNREFFDFKYARLDQRCSIGHFQLRNLLWATSKNDVYYVCEYSHGTGIIDDY